ncbi:hypothetical protein D9M71_499520 [compost metagenome]
MGNQDHRAVLLLENPMTRQEQFLAKALEVHHEYQQATAIIHAMMSKNITVGPEWDAAVARQLAALDSWMELPRGYGDLRANN